VHSVAPDDAADVEFVDGGRWFERRHALSSQWVWRADGARLTVRLPLRITSGNLL